MPFLGINFTLAVWSPAQWHTFAPNRKEESGSLLSQLTADASVCWRTSVYSTTHSESIFPTPQPYTLRALRHWRWRLVTTGSGRWCCYFTELYFSSFFHHTEEPGRSNTAFGFHTQQRARGKAVFFEPVSNRMVIYGELCSAVTPIVPSYSSWIYFLNCLQYQLGINESNKRIFLLSSMSDIIYQLMIHLADNNIRLRITSRQPP